MNARKEKLIPQEPPPATRCPNRACWALPEVTIVCRLCGSEKVKS